MRAIIAVNTAHLPVRGMGIGRFISMRSMIAKRIRPLPIHFAVFLSLLNFALSNLFSAMFPPVSNGRLFQICRCNHHYEITWEKKLEPYLRPFDGQHSYP